MESGYDTGGADAGATGGRPASAGRSGNGAGGTGGTPIDVPPWGIADGFDPSDVYLLGTIEGSTPTCTHYAVARASEPNQYAPAFPCTLPNRFTISNGKLYYEIADGHEIHEFVPDYSDTYPTNPFANDKKVDAPCSALIMGYVFSPSGKMIYQCLGLGWFETGGASAYKGQDTIIAYTDHKVVATVEGVLDFNEMMVHPVPALANAFGVRVHEAEFHYAIQPDALKAPQLWSVDATGTTTKLGDYAAAPSGVKSTGAVQPLLAPDDTLYMSGSLAGAEVIYRRTIDGKSEVVYTEADDTVVKIDLGSVLITGP